MCRKALLLILVLALGAIAHGQVAQAQSDSLPSGEWRAYPLELVYAHAYRFAMPLHQQPFVPLQLTVAPERVLFTLEAISVAASDLTKTAEVALKRVEDSYASEEVRIGEGEFSGRSTFSLVPLSATRAMLTEHHVAFEGTRTQRWILTFGESDDPRQALIRCEGSPPSRLASGVRAIAIGEMPLEVRAQPSLSAAVSFEVPLYVSPEDSAQTAVLDVLEGPVCGDELIWWRVRFEGREGWAAEGNLESYYLEFFEPEQDQALDGDPLVEQLKSTATPSR